MRAIGDDLAAQGIKFSLGGQVYNPTDPMGKMFFNILATVAGLIALLGRGGKTSVMATHDLDVLVVVADRCVVFSEAHSIAAGATPRELLSDRELLRSVNLVYGCSRPARLDPVVPSDL